MFSPFHKHAIRSLAIDGCNVDPISQCLAATVLILQPFKDEWQTALFKDPVRTALSTLFISVIKTNQLMV
jgi:hypothetical protein